MQKINVIDYINIIDSGKKFLFIDPILEERLIHKFYDNRSQQRAILPLGKQDLLSLNVLICMEGSLHEEYTILAYSSIFKLKYNIMKEFQNGHENLYLFVLIPDGKITLKTSDDCDLNIYIDNFSHEDIVTQLYQIYLKKKSLML